MNISFKSFSMDFSRRTFVMGILNVTPDSFSDGGLYFEKSLAIERAKQMVEDGADIIDIGGESTRPGAEPVSLDEELNRTIPVIEVLAREIKVPISIDTYKSVVAEKAINAGASIVNDISGLKFDPEMAKVVAKHKVPVVVMHIKGTPRNMQKEPFYENLIVEIKQYLEDSINIALNAGVEKDKIIVDPGIGFGKTFEHNLEIIHKLSEFSTFDRPVLIGLSRKAFIGKILNNAPAQERVEGTAAAVAISIMNGANIIRVHDVKQMVMVAKVADAIKKMRIEQK